MITTQDFVNATHKTSEQYMAALYAYMARTFKARIVKENRLCFTLHVDSGNIDHDLGRINHVLTKVMCMTKLDHTQMYRDGYRVIRLDILESDNSGTDMFIRFYYHGDTK